MSTDQQSQDLLGNGPRSFTELREEVRKGMREISDSHGPIECTDVILVQAYQNELIRLLSWALSRAIAIGASRE